MADMSKTCMVLITISDETLFRVFDFASQIIIHAWRNSKQNLTKFYDN